MELEGARRTRLRLNFTQAVLTKRLVRTLVVKYNIFHKFAAKTLVAVLIFGSNSKLIASSKVHVNHDLFLTSRHLIKSKFDLIWLSWVVMKNLKNF